MEQGVRSKMTCSSCGKENPKDLKFCIYCGQELVSAKEAVGSEPKSCRSRPQCGFENLPEARFCSKCGTSLAGASPIGQLSRASTGWLIGGIAAVVAFLVLFLATKPWLPTVQWQEMASDERIIFAPVGAFGAIHGCLVKAKGGAYLICPFCRESVKWRSTACTKCGKSFRWVTTRCPACDGTGICNACDVSGRCTVRFEREHEIECPFCEGNGKCHSCEGDGTVGNEEKG